MSLLTITTDITADKRLELNKRLRTKYGSIGNVEAQRIAYYCGVPWRAVILWFAANAKTGGPVRIDNINDCYIHQAGKPGEDPTMENGFIDDGQGLVPLSEVRARFSVAAVLGDGLHRHALYTGDTIDTEYPANTLLEALQLVDRIYSGYEDISAGFPISKAWVQLRVEFADKEDIEDPTYSVVCLYNEFVLGDSPKVDRDCENEEGIPDSDAPGT